MNTSKHVFCLQKCKITTTIESNWNLCIPVNRKYLEMPVAFREKTQFAISYVAYIAAGRVRTDKEEKIKVFVDAGCSTSSKCKHGQAGQGR